MLTFNNIGSCSWCLIYERISRWKESLASCLLWHPRECLLGQCGLPNFTKVSKGWACSPKPFQFLFPTIVFRWLLLDVFDCLYNIHLSTCIFIVLWSYFMDLNFWPFNYLVFVVKIVVVVKRLGAFLMDLALYKCFLLSLFLLFALVSGVCLLDIQEKGISHSFLGVTTLTRAKTLWWTRTYPFSYERLFFVSRNLLHRFLFYSLIYLLHVFRVYRRGTEGPVVLYLHGGGLSALSWSVLSVSSFHLNLLVKDPGHYW